MSINWNDEMIKTIFGMKELNVKIWETVYIFFPYQTEFAGN